VQLADGTVAETIVERDHGGFRSVTREELPDGQVRETRQETSAAVQVSFFGISAGATFAGGGRSAGVAFVVESRLDSDGGPFPAKIPPGQGLRLSGTVPMDESLSVSSGRVHVEATTNDGRTFGDEIDVEIDGGTVVRLPPR
jgi:hypothetical protein